MDARSAPNRENLFSEKREVGGRESKARSTSRGGRGGKGNSYTHFSNPLVGNCKVGCSGLAWDECTRAKSAMQPARISPPHTAPRSCWSPSEGTEDLCLADPREEGLAQGRRDALAQGTLQYRDKSHPVEDLQCREMPVPASTCALASLAPHGRAPLPITLFPVSLLPPPFLIWVPTHPFLLPDGASMVWLSSNWKGVGL